jgi:acetyl-CoA synthetase
VDLPVSIHQYNIGYICSGQQCEAGKSDHVAMHWISPNTLERSDFTFYQLEQESNRFANALVRLGFKEGDIVFTFLPSMPELFIAFLGILKIKAIVGTLFSNFGDEALLDRLQEAKGIITKKSLLKKIQRIQPELPKLSTIIVIDAEEHILPVAFSYQKLMGQASPEYVVPETSAQTPSVLHYTSGSTGKPKGVLHVHGSVISQNATAREVLKLNDQEIFWCTADQGWVTGTSYGIIGPWSLGVTQVFFGGGFNPQDWFTVLEKEKISIWYTAPTALRMLMRQDPRFYAGFDLGSLKHIFSVGEPLNPEVFVWVQKVLGHQVYDTWFQTETGSIMIANRPDLPVKPGSMGKPVSGINAAVVSDSGNIAETDQSGNLCLVPGWPSMFVTYLKNEKAYSQKFHHGYYFSGDMATCDQDGYYWFLGRNDDVINSAGHLVSPFEVESSLLEVEGVAEAGVIGVPDEVLFEKVVAFVVLKKQYQWSQELDIKLKLHINNRISSVAVPQDIRIVESLPKTKSGKIMRRVLRATYLNQPVGDMSTLEI